MLPVVWEDPAEKYLCLFDQTLLRFQNHNKWTSARFGQVKLISNTLVGDVGQRFIEEACRSLGVPFALPLKGDGTRETKGAWDIEICGFKYELKTATEDVSGCFQFNHIRYHRSYDGLICLGITPHALLFDVWTAADVKTGKAGRLVSMEKGANASYKLTKRPGNLRPIADFREVISTFKC